MKLFACVLAIGVLAFAGCGGGDETGDMSQFSSDLSQFMTEEATEGGWVAVKVTATCHPAKELDNAADCDIVVRNNAGEEDKATAENVRRDGDKFVWDHES